MDDAATRQALDDYARAVATAPDANTAFRLAENIAADLIGHRLFTVMAFHSETMEVERCYSSNPERYPTGGRKKKRDTAWGDHVLTQSRHFIGYDADDIRANFNDHTTIMELGLESVLNMPIRVDGKTLGTMNLLEKANFYSEDHVLCVRMIAEPLARVLNGALSE